VGVGDGMGEGEGERDRGREGERERERERERSNKSGPNCSSRSKMMDRRVVAVNCKQSHATFRVICPERL